MGSRFKGAMCAPFGAAAALLAAAAQAQTTPQPAGPQATPEPTASSTVQEIVVTGSRIARRDYASDTPIVTVGQGAIAASGAPTIDQALNQLPQVAASAGSASSLTARGGQASIDLRGLGQQRTLVLLNGRRLEPSNPDGSVDLNIIPRALVDNVEVITGGASSVYGSDAVTGVVNVKLKSHFEGLELDAQVGASDKADALTRDIELTAGTSFAGGKGQVFGSFDYADRDGLLFPARGYLHNQALTTTFPQGLLLVNSSNLPTQAAVNGVFSGYGVAAGTVSRSAQLGFNTDGTLFQSLNNYRGSTSDPFAVLNNTLYSDTGFFNLAQIPLTKYSAFGHGSYELSPHLKLFAEGFYTSYDAATLGPPPNSSSTSNLLIVPVTNPFIPAALRTILASRPSPNAAFNIQKRFDTLGARTEEDHYDVYQFTVGGSGDFGFRDWTWDTDVSYGRTQYLATERNYPLVSRLDALLAAPGGGTALCDGGFNPFGLQPLSAGCASYITRDEKNRTTLDQLVVEANIQGSLLKLPAGDLRFAAGADYRRNTYDFRPTPDVASGDLANFNPILASRGSEDVKEVYGELLVPVLRDLPLIREFNLDLGYRYSDYDTVGGENTYKADFDWAVAGGVRLRGGYSRAIRAPSVGELYQAATQSSVSLGTLGPIPGGDPCDVRSGYRTAGGASAAAVRALCLAQGVPGGIIDTYLNTSSRTPFTTSGNTALQAETADTYSIGAVWRPHFSNPLFSRVTISVDYYDIKLNGAIGQVTTPLAVSKCFNADGSNPSYSAANYFCNLIARSSASGVVTNVTTPLLNLGGYKTSGIDMEADWSFGLGAVGLSDGWGRVSLSTVISYLDSFRIQTLPGAATFDYAGTILNTQIDPFADAHPRWKATSTATYGVGTVDLSVKWRYLDDMANAGNVGTTGVLPGVKATNYFDLDAVWRINSKLELRGGLVNLLDHAPPIVTPSPVGQYQTDLNTYDLIGRRFYVNLKARF